jgi:hypothetical protein
VKKIAQNVGELKKYVANYREKMATKSGNFYYKNCPNIPTIAQ